MYSGIANQRETTIVWDRVSGEPLYPAIVWSDTRTKDTLQQIINRFALYTPTVLRIRDVYRRSRIRLFSIPDPGSKLFPSRIRITELKYFNPKKMVCKL